MTTQLCLDREAAGSDRLTPPAALARLLATAQSEIDRHLNGSGTCTWCERPWPCSTACLAEFTLGAF
jgi:hypothetical protein